MIENNYNPQRASEDIDIRRLLSTLWNKKLFFLIVFLIGFCITIWGVSLIKTSYTARSLVLVESEATQEQVEQIASIMKVSPFQTASILTELEVLKSRSLATKVVKRLGLVNDPEFNKKTSHSGASVNIDLTANQQSTFKTLSVDGSEMKVLQAESVDDEVALTVSSFLEHLTVASVPGSLAIQISFSSQNPKKASFILNTLIDEYLAQRLDEKLQTQNRLSEWLNKRLSELREQVAEAEKKAEQYRVENKLVVGNREIISTEQLSALNAELTDARAKYLDAKIKYEQSTKVGGKIDNLSAMKKAANSGLVKDLELQKVRLKADIADLSNRYGPRHPIMISKKSELLDLETKINEEFAKVNEVLRNEMNIAKARVNEIQSDIDEAAAQVTHNGDALIGIRELEREAEASRMVLKTFLETYKKTLGSDDLQEAGARVLSYANTPFEPTSPDKVLILLLGTFVSTLLGIIAALIAGKMDTRIKTIEDLMMATGLKCSAIIPYVRGLGKESLTKYIHKNPSSPLTEAVRALYVELSKKNQDNKVISFISTDDHEGKTTLATLLSAVMVKAGRKVVLIDANLRQPGVGEAIKKSAGSTLVEYLTGHKSLEDVIVKDQETSLDIIFGQAIPNTAFDLLNSKKMKALIAALRDQYDHIIIDSPACSKVSDAKLLAGLSDQNICIVNWNKARQERVHAAIKYFRDIPNTLLLVALNKVKK